VQTGAEITVLKALTASTVHLRICNICICRFKI